MGTTPIAWHQCAEMAVRSFSDPFPPAATSARRLEYFCAITYVDQQIGRLLDTLDIRHVAPTDATAARVPFADFARWSVLLYRCFSHLPQPLHAPLP